MRGSDRERLALEKSGGMKATLLMALFLVLVGKAGAQTPTAPVVLKGQIACSKCWTEADRKKTPYGGKDDLECAVECTAKGLPTNLVVNWDADAIQYQLEYGKLKKTGNGWLDYTAKIVEVSGTVSERKGKRYVKVNEIKVISDSPAIPSAPAGAQAPDIILKDIAGAPQSLSGYRGKIVVLNFWATWCGPCKGEMPEFVKIQNQYAAFGVQVIGASADGTDKRGAVIQFVRENRINFPIWLGATTDGLAAFGLGPALPGTVVIDRDGKIAAHFRGVVTEAQLKQEIDRLLAEPVKETGETAPAGDAVAAREKSSSVPS